MICSNCGRSLSEASSVPPTQYASPSSGVAPTQYASPPSTDPYGSSAYGASAPSTDPYGSSAYGASSTPITNPYSSSPYEVISAPPPPSGAAPGPRKGPPVIAIVGAVVLLIVLLGGGIFFFTRGKTTTTSTTTPAALTATAEASQALFFDNFANNGKGWTVGQTATSSQAISNNTLILQTSDTTALLNEFLPTKQPFSDFKLVVSYTMQQGDKNDYLGIALRSKSDFSQDYEVHLWADGSYTIGKDYLDSSGNIQFKTLFDTKTPTFNSVGKPNTVTIIMVGNTLVFMNGNTVVKTITDGSYATGQIGLFLYHGNTSSGITVAVSSIAVYPPPSQLPS